MIVHGDVEFSNTLQTKKESENPDDDFESGDENDKKRKKVSKKAKVKEEKGKEIRYNKQITDNR